jgi:hypothetical protein
MRVFCSVNNLRRSSKVDTIYRAERKSGVNRVSRISKVRMIKQGQKGE